MRFIRRAARPLSACLLGTLFYAATYSDMNAQVVVKNEAKAEKKDEKKKREDYTDGLFLFVDRDASRKIEAIKQNLKREKIPWDILCDALQTLMEDTSDKLIETERNTANGPVRTKVSVKEEANRMIAGFPKEGREFYQVTYGARAEAKLKDAFDANSSDLRDPMQKLADISTMYLHTKAGAEAIIRLGTWHLDRGRYLMAALTLRKFEQRSPEDVLPPSMLLKLAIAYKRLGEPKYAAEYWDKLAKAVGSNELALGNRKFTIDQLKGEYERVVVRSRNEAEEYVTIGGDSTHNAQGIGGRPFLDPRFQFSMTPRTKYNDAWKNKDGVEITNSKPAMEWIEQNLDESIKRVKRQANPAIIPAFFPVTAPGKIVIRTYEKVYCIWTKETPEGDKPGDVCWAADAESSLFKIIENSSTKNQFENTWFRQFYAQHGPFGVFYENGLVGTLSHDGKYVYFVDDLFVPPHPLQVFQFSQNGQQMQFGAFEDKVVRNRLVAINLESGKLEWITGDKTDSEARKKLGANAEKTPETGATLLPECYFLGVPLPIAGKIYAVIEKDREMVLACLNPARKDEKTGHPELEWHQPLGSPQSPLPQDSFRRIQGIHLAYADGVLVVPTNAGAIVGIDLQSRNIIWSHSYRKAAEKKEDPNENTNIRINMMRRGMNMEGAMGSNNLVPDRWRVSYPILTKNRVVFTAYDSSSIQCLDMRSGEMAWEHTRQGDDLYVAGVFEDRVMVVGKGSLRFISLADGAQIGQSVTIGMPSGVGTASNGLYLLPVAESPENKDPEIWTIDVAKGTVVAKTRSRKKAVAGNLVFHEGDVYSQSPTELTAFPQLQVKKDEMNRRLRTDPNDPLGLTAMGELQLDDGELVPSIGTLQKVLSMDIKDDLRTRARLKLYESMTELVQGDFAKSEKYLAEYKELCALAVPANADPAQKQAIMDEELRRKSNFYSLVGKGREGQGRLLDAFDNYRTFGTLVGNRDMINVIDQPTTAARPDVWARGRIEAMLRASKQDVRKPLEDKIDGEWDKVKDANDIEKLRAFVKLFGNPELKAGNESRLLLAANLMRNLNEDDLREAELLLMTLDSGRDKDVAARAVDTLAKLYMKRSLFEPAVKMYQRLGREYASVTLPEGRTGEALYNELVTDKRFLPYLEPARAAWTGKMKVEDVAGGGAMVNAFQIVPDDEDASPFFERNRVFVETNGNNNMWVLRVVDRVSGADVFRSKPLQSPQQVNINLANHGYAFNYGRLYQVKGHILVLQSANMVYCFDLASKKQLWPEYNLFGKNPPLNNNMQRVEPEPDGSMRILYQDGTYQRIGSVGLLQPNYLCLMTRDGLVALDPLTGSVLWTKRNVSANTRVIGDQEHILYYELSAQGGATAPKAVRASDGVEVSVPDQSLLLGKSRKLREYGLKVLVQDSEGDKRTLRLVDLMTGKDVWRKEIAEKSLLAATDDARLVGFVTFKGLFQVFDGRTGKRMFEANLDPAKVAEQMGKAEAAVLLVDADRFYLGITRPPVNPKEVAANANSGCAVHIRTVPLKGLLYAFNRKTAKVDWYTEEQFDLCHLVTDRFAEIPVVIGTSYSFANGGQRYKCVVLDKATGKSLFGKELFGSGGYFHSLNVDPKARTVELVRNDIRVRVSPLDAPKTAAAPPAPQSGTGTIIMRGNVQIEIKK